MFHSEIINNADQLNKESKNFKEIPIISNVMPRQVLDNFHQVKLEIKNLISREIYSVCKKTHLFKKSLLIFYNRSTR